jgi:hypothetical protein
MIHSVSQKLIRCHCIIAAEPYRGAQSCTPPSAHLLSKPTIDLPLAWTNWPPCQRMRWRAGSRCP